MSIFILSLVVSVLNIGVIIVKICGLPQKKEKREKKKREKKKMKIYYNTSNETLNVK